MRDEDGFDFRRADAFAGDFNCVVGTTENVPKSVVIDRGPIAVNPYVGETRPVGVDVTLAIFPKTARHTDPGLANHQLAHLSAHRVSILINHVGGHSRKGSGKRAWLHRCEHIAHYDSAGD